jgi:cleavage and polyadenylation specificity factor subunit 4
VKSNNRENLELSVERGLWATHRNNEAKLNEAFDTCDHVILVFSVNETRHFQVAKCFPFNFRNSLVLQT